MNRFIDGIVHHKKLVIIIFLIAVAVCVVLQMFVNTNYSMADYLPAEAQSTKAIEIMEDEFSQAMPNTKVMVRDVTVTQAREYKQALAVVDGVTEVIWLDDVVDIKQPLEIADSQTVQTYYKDGNALFSVAIEDGKQQQACAAILSVIGEENALAGDVPNQVALQDTTQSEVLTSMLILIPIVIVILLMATTSWLEPVLILAAIGVSVLINMGTNIIVSEISFITKAVVPILQLACSLDYAIFLLHSFAEHRKSCPNAAEAMKRAVKESISTVGASAATTLFGFLALVFMQFGIGGDLGLSLAKGILFSFLAVMVFLPALALAVYKGIDRTQHRALMPSFKNIYRVMSKVTIVAVVVVALAAVPAFLGQGQTRFTYGIDMETDTDMRIGRDAAAIEETFGKFTVMAMLVPSGSVADEKALCEQIEQIEHVNSVVSYTTSVGAQIPTGFLDEDVTSRFYSENHARIIIYTDTIAESEAAFQVVEAIEEAGRMRYGDEVYLAGQSASIYDMRTVLKQDFTMVTLIAVLAIFAVLLVTFRSAVLPFILLLTIEVGIWINLAIPYFGGTTIGFIGYLIISSVQLGATVDYAILMTNNHMRSRRLLPRAEAVGAAMGQSFRPILVSASILAAAGFALAGTSSNVIIHELGMLVGRGALLSLAMVTLFLPGMLRLLDGAIGKATYKAGFLSKKKHKY